MQLAPHAGAPRLGGTVPGVHLEFPRHPQADPPSAPPSPCVRLSRTPTTTRAPPPCGPSPFSAASPAPCRADGMGSRVPMTDLGPLGGMLYPLRFGDTG